MPGFIGYIVLAFTNSATPALRILVRSRTIMDLNPTKRTSLHAKADAGLGRGMDFALVVLAFLGIGYVLDRWFDTKPVFMIILVVLALVGQFANLWYGYDARMKAFEAERANNTTGAGRPGRASTGTTSGS